MSFLLRTNHWLAALIAVFALAGAASAQAWPDRPIRMVVPFPPAQNTDIVARYFASKLSVALGKQVFVENKPGAFGNIGTAYAARQPADGYTVMMTAAGPLAMNPALYEHTGFDSEKDFEPVVVTSVVPMVIAVNPTLGVSSLQELAQLARSKPNKVDVAMASVSSQLVLEMLRERDVPLFGVKYKGSADAITAVLGNQVPVLIDTLAAARAQLGKITPIAVTTAKGVASLPQVKSVAEQGMDGFSMTAWNALMVPTGTPVEIRERLASEMSKLLAMPETIKALDDFGLVPATPMKHEELVSWMRTEREKYGKIIRDSKMKP